MKRTCSTCGQAYDDASCSTICPHDEFLTPEEARRKDAAVALLGHEICFAHQPNGPSHQIRSVSWDGMVTLADMTGEFAPHLFVVAKS